MVNFANPKMMNLVHTTADELLGAKNSQSNAVEETTLTGPAPAISYGSPIVAEQNDLSASNNSELNLYAGINVETPTYGSTSSISISID